MHGIEASADGDGLGGVNDESSEPMTTGHFQRCIISLVGAFAAARQREHLAPLARTVIHL